MIRNLKRFDLLLIQTVIAEHKQWTGYNFPHYQEPQLGLLEELGEFSHQLLKKGQKIRKTSVEDEQDCIADAAIFYFHLCWKHGHVHYESPEPILISVEWHLAHAAIHAGHIMADIADNSHPSTIHMIGVWDNLCAICHLNEWDFEKLVRLTWDEVKKRDFVEYPATGKPPEI